MRQKTSALLANSDNARKFAHYNCVWFRESQFLTKFENNVIQARVKRFSWKSLKSFARL